MRSLGIALILLLPLLNGGLQASGFPLADKVLVDKSDRKLYLLQGDEAIRTFDIALGIRPVGDKQYEGDFRTPEGRYRLDLRNPESEYFLSIRVSYPNGQDIREARRLLDEINLQIPAGQTIGITGPTGSGKTLAFGIPIVATVDRRRARLAYQHRPPPGRTPAMGDQCRVAGRYIHAGHCTPGRHAEADHRRRCGLVR